jgi:ArsR family transcriptional regulator
MPVRFETSVNVNNSVAAAAGFFAAARRARLARFFTTRFAALLAAFFGRFAALFATTLFLADFLARFLTALLAGFLAAFLTDSPDGFAAVFLAVFFARPELLRAVFFFAIQGLLNHQTVIENQSLKAHQLSRIIKYNPLSVNLKNRIHLHVFGTRHARSAREPRAPLDGWLSIIYPFIRMKGLKKSGPLFDRIAELGDPVRCRLLLALDSEELTVSEICQVMQLPQSTASRHLRILVGGGWVTRRRDGTSRRYRGAIDRQPSSTRNLWLLLRDELAQSSAAAQDRRRLRDVVAQRQSRSQEFFSTAAGQWAELRRRLFGQRFEVQALVSLLDPDWTIGDLGCGTGELTETLAAGTGQVIAVDESDAMLEAARGRLNGRANVELRQGRIESLPIADGELDAATLVLVLHYLREPLTAVREAARTLRPGGRLLVVDMLPHERAEYRQQMGHVWLGFEPDEVKGWLRRAGLKEVNLRSLPTDVEARGPALFAAVAVKPPAGDRRRRARPGARARGKRVRGTGGRQNADRR